MNPETIIGDTTHTAIDVIANQDDPNTSNKSGVAEFDAPAYRTVALRGSDSADAPFLLIALDTTGRSGVLVKYSLRDFNPAPSNAVQSFALQYRVGTSGDFFTVPAGFVANANNPSQAGGVTPVSAELPPDADNQPIVQVRIITANAVGDDEWIGVDDILIDAPQIDLSAVGQADPSIVGVGDTTVMRVTVTPGLNPTSTGIAVSADLSAIGGPADQPLAEGLAGVFSVSTLVAATTTPGMKHLPVSVTDAQGRTASFDIVLEVRATTPPSVVGSASPAQVFPGDSTLLTATVTPGAFPSSSGISVTADLTAIGGSGAQQLFDDGTHGDQSAGDNVYCVQYLVGLATSPGLKSVSLSVTDAQGRAGAGTILLTVLEPASVSISQVYGGGGNSGASLKNDFVELLNRGTNTVSLSGWSLQYTSAAGATWQVTPLTGSIPPGGYYLIQQAQGAGGTVNLPPPDAIGIIPMSATAGKVALVRTTAALTDACPLTSGLPIFLDFVGYGTANCFEGSGPVGSQ